jgi:hypothetical protein
MKSRQPTITFKLLLVIYYLLTSVTLLSPFLPPDQPFAAKGSGRSDTKNSRKNFFCGDKKEMN